MWHLIKTILLLLPTIIWDYFAWIIKYASHPDKYPLEERYNKVRKLIRKANKRLKFDLIIEGKENIPNETSCFFINHLAAADPLLLIEVIDAPLTLVAKKEIEKMPLVGKVFKGINGQFLDRSDLKQQLGVMQQVELSMKNKECHWAIYPEGTRNKDPMNLLLPFHNGAFRSAMKAEVPIVPVVCYGAQRALNTKHSYKKYPTYIKFLKPIYTS